MSGPLSTLDLTGLPLDIDVAVTQQVDVKREVQRRADALICPYGRSDQCRQRNGGQLCQVRPPTLTLSTTPSLLLSSSIVALNSNTTYQFFL